MFSSPTPVGKRPEIKQTPSSKWSLPHFAPMKEQRGQSSPTSPTRRSSSPPTSYGPRIQEMSPTPVEVKRLPEDRPLSPVLSTTGSATTTERPEAAGMYGSMRAGEFRDSVSTVDSVLARSPPVALEEQPKSTGKEVEDPSYQDYAYVAPANTPIPQVTDTTGAPVPYYAMPKIMVHKPSSSSVSEGPDTLTIDEVLARERQAESLTTIPPMPTALPAPAWKVPDAITAGPDATGNLPNVPIGVPGLPDASKTLKQKKRVAYKWKARNLAARMTILNATLGRQLAGPTKQALRSLAKGQTVALENLAVVG